MRFLALAAELATDVYHDPATMVVRARDRFGMGAAPFQAGSLVGAVFERDDVIVVAIRGTDPTWRDWASNFIAWLSPVPYSRERRAHAGYLLSTKIAWPVIAAQLRGEKNKPVVVTGHSQGGAEAELIADRVSEFGLAGWPGVTVITFGAPPVWAKGDATRCLRFRFVHVDDVIPLARIPAVGPQQPAEDDGYDVCLIDYDQFRWVSNAGAAAIHLARVVTHGVFRGKLFRRLVAHRMDGYRDAVVARFGDLEL